MLIKAEEDHSTTGSPGDACLTLKGGYTASPRLFHFKTGDGLRVEGSNGRIKKGGRDNETKRKKEEREGRMIDLGRKATAVGWRSLVWSHSYGSLQQNLLAILKTSLAPCKTL